MRDLRDTIRLLGRSPGFVATVTLTLALAIAGNTAVLATAVVATMAMVCSLPARRVSRRAVAVTLRSE